MTRSPEAQPLMRRRRWRDLNVGWFYDPTYRASIEVLWPSNADRVNRYIREHHGFADTIDDDFGMRCIHLDDHEGHEVVMILVRAWDMNEPALVALLAHECFHAAEFILADRGLPHCAQSSEAYAYLIESIMRRSLWVLGR